MRFEFTIDQIARACTRLVKQRKNGFMPTVAEIIETIEQIEGKTYLTIEQQAELQANIVLECLR
ncbi:MAG: hypothetical protein HQK74_11495 [Desulfamplus sp.]|nr:hypothetical protein [Desulfamplus sp.]